MREMIQAHATSLWKEIRMQIFFVFALTLLLAGLTALSGNGKAAFVSSEVQFTDSSLKSGLSIVPASCPSDPHNAGECAPPPPPPPLPPPSIGFESFQAEHPSGSFIATGHLQVRPTLVRGGDTVQGYWNVKNVSSCSVIGNNGDSWNGASSDASGETSRGVQRRTTFTLHCTAILGATPPSVTESQIVNITPLFQEQ